MATKSFGGMSSPARGGIEGKSPAISTGPRIASVGIRSSEGFSSRILSETNFVKIGTPSTPTISRGPTISSGNGYRLAAFIPGRELPATGQEFISGLRPFEPGSAMRRANAFASRNLPTVTLHSGTTRSEQDHSGRSVVNSVGNSEVSQTRQRFPVTDLTRKESASNARQIGGLRRFDPIVDGARTNLLRRTHDVTIADLPPRRAAQQVILIETQRPPDYSRTAQTIDAGLTNVVSLEERRRAREMQPRPAQNETNATVVSLETVRRRLSQEQQALRQPTRPINTAQPEATHDAVVIPFPKQPSESQNAGSGYVNAGAWRKMLQKRHQRDEEEERYHVEEKRIEEGLFNPITRRVSSVSNPFTTATRDSFPFPGSYEHLDELLGRQRKPYHVAVGELLQKLRRQDSGSRRETIPIDLINDLTEKEKDKTKGSKVFEMWSYNGNPSNPQYDQYTRIEDQGIVNAIESHLRGTARSAVKINGLTISEYLHRVTKRKIAATGQTGLRLHPEKAADLKVLPATKTDATVAAMPATRMNPDVSPQQRMRAEEREGVERQDAEVIYLANGQNRRHVKDRDAALERLEQIDGGIANAENLPDGRITGAAVVVAAKKFTERSRSAILRMLTKLSGRVDGSEAETWTEIAHLPASSRRRIRWEAGRIVANKPPVDIGESSPVRQVDVDRVYNGGAKVAA